MAKSAESRRTLSSRQFRSSPYPTSRPHLPEIKDYDKATCSVCMEFPHNAVLLLCSSHNNGCRPYMCGTSDRHSNCLDQFNRTCTKIRYTTDLSMFPGTVWNSSELPQISELACPLCRGLVKGWTVVESARKYLNDMKRNCVHDDCSFVGKYEELEEHAKSGHPYAKPREVDAVIVEKWRMLELESEWQDAIGTLRSSAPESTVFGDHVFGTINDEVFQSLTNFYVLRDGTYTTHRPTNAVAVAADVSVDYSPEGNDGTYITGGSRHSSRRLDEI